MAKWNIFFDDMAHTLKVFLDGHDLTEMGLKEFGIAGTVETPFDVFTPVQIWFKSDMVIEKPFCKHDDIFCWDKEIKDRKVLVKICPKCKRVVPALISVTKFARQNCRTLKSLAEVKEELK